MILVVAVGFGAVMSRWWCSTGPVGGVLGPVGAPDPDSWGLLPTEALMLG